MRETLKASKASRLLPTLVFKISLPNFLYERKFE